MGYLEPTQQEAPPALRAAQAPTPLQPLLLTQQPARAVGLAPTLRELALLQLQAVSTAVQACTPLLWLLPWQARARSVLLGLTLWA